MYDDMLSLLDNADPQTLQLMLQALNSGETMGMGQSLTQTPTPEGRNVGHTYVASSPLEHLSAALQRGVGYGLVGRGQQQRGTGIQAYIDALRAGRGPSLDQYKWLSGGFDNPENYG